MFPRFQPRSDLLAVATRNPGIAPSTEFGRRREVLRRRSFSARHRVATPAAIRLRPPSHLPTSIQGIVDSGDVLYPPGPGAKQLIGDWRWADEYTVFWFPAFGDNLRDAHLLRVDRIQWVPNIGVRFYREQRVLACLSPIRSAPLEDRVDYRVAWKIWQQVAPLRRHLIDECWRKLTQTDLRSSRHDGP